MNPFAVVYSWWEGIPSPIREPIRSAAVTVGLSTQLTFWLLFGAAAQDGHLTSPLDFIGYCWTHAWGAVVGILLPIAYRSRQGFASATKTMTTDSYVSVPIVAPPKEGA